MLISMCSVEVEENLKDPDSFKVDRSRTLATQNSNGYSVEMVFRANNSFGATVPGTAICAFGSNGKDNKPLLESKEKAFLKSVSINGKRI
ncbi:Uncharacterised protein [Buttiauxella agrestis]|uniref:Uncharacterized protein n=2 Tax=Buttiauxella agrestis TaxID=82977 RepID=A0A381C6J9_9ENTR|nr:Uncharacterised protein [Buttiauxella agrestis]